MKKPPRRCDWPGAADDLMVAYHDREWGTPSAADATHFEFLVLESAQAGLSWATILRKRENYRRAFAGFDAARVARFSARKIETLMADASIVRNRKKIEAAVNNARVFLDVAGEFGSFARYIWGFVDGRPRQTGVLTRDDLRATSPESDALAADMKRRGFRFVGSIVLYSHMQATGLFNDHERGCFRQKECAALAKAFRVDGA